VMKINPSTVSDKVKKWWKT